MAKNVILKNESGEELHPKTEIAQVDGLQGNLDEKQSKLVSGGNIKTINGFTILGEGNITLPVSGEVDSSETWYYTPSVREGQTIDSISYDFPAATTSTFGFAIANTEGLNQIRNKPINLIRFRLSPDETATSGSMNIAIMPIQGTTYSHFLTLSFTPEDIEDSWVKVRLEDTVYVADDETVVIQPVDDNHSASSIRIAILRASVATTTDPYINTYYNVPRSWTSQGNYITRLGVAVELGYTESRITAPLDKEANENSHNGIENGAITKFVKSATKSLKNIYFGYDFTDTTESSGSYVANFDTTALKEGWSNGTLSAEGFSPALGFANQVLIQKYYVCDDISTQAHVKLTALDSILAFGSKVRTDGAGGRSVGSLVKFDFANKKMIICKKTDGSTVSDAYTEVDVSEIVLDGQMEYILTVGRENSRVFASISNYATGDTIHKRVDDISVSDFSPVGRFYDYLTFSQISGSTAYWLNLYTYVPSDVRIAFIGDSITQGIYLPTVGASYVSQLKKYYGNCVSSGRGGAKIDFLLDAMDDGLVSAFRPRYVSVAIGTNEGNTKEKLALLISKIKEIGAIPIINCVSQTVDGKSTDDNELIWDINSMILSMHELGARFDIATGASYNPALPASSEVLQDAVHPNSLGHARMAERFKFDLNCLK